MEVRAGLILIQNILPSTYSSEEDLSHAIFWSSDKYTGVMGNVSGDTPGAELAFGVNFGTGHIKAYSISVGPKHFVRCVRGNLAYGVNLFQNNGDGTISDLATGLMWQQTDNGSGMDWEHALAYAQTQNNANYLGHNDWRLPNTKELQSLVDYTRSPGATNSANVGPAINPMFSCTGILNDGGKADYPYYWTSTSAIPKQMVLMLMHGMWLLGGQKMETAKTFTVPVQCVLTLRYWGAAQEKKGF